MALQIDITTLYQIKISAAILKSNVTFIIMCNGFIRESIIDECANCFNWRVSIPPLSNGILYAISPQLYLPSGYLISKYAMFLQRMREAYSALQTENNTSHEHLNTQI